MTRSIECLHFGKRESHVPFEGWAFRWGREPVSSCCAGTLLKGMGSVKSKSLCLSCARGQGAAHFLWRVENKDQTPGTSWVSDSHWPKQALFVPGGILGDTQARASWISMYWMLVTGRLVLCVTHLTFVCIPKEDPVRRETLWTLCGQTAVTVPAVTHPAEM